MTRIVRRFSSQRWSKKTARKQELQTTKVLGAYVAKNSSENTVDGITTNGSKNIQNRLVGQNE
jgi:hypothetical protein